MESGVLVAGENVTSPQTDRTDTDHEHKAPPLCETTLGSLATMLCGHWGAGSAHCPEVPSTA